jgi:hypothetical protein
VTSLEKVTQRPISMREVEDTIVHRFADVFERVNRMVPPR